MVKEKGIIYDSKKELINQAGRKLEKVNSID